MGIRIKRGVEALRTSIIPNVGEPIFTTDTKKLYVGDGSTPGGIPVDTTDNQDVSGKQDTLVSGTNIKTINGSSILGSGDLVIAGGGGDGGGVTDHGALDGLTDDDHPQYLRADGTRSLKGDLSVQNIGAVTKEYRFRTSGGSLDTEGAGADWVFSMWSNVGFTGTQYDAFILSASGGPVAFGRGISTSSGAKVGGVTYGATRQTNDYTVGDGVTVVFMDCTGGNRTVTVPSGWSSGNLGRTVKVRRVDGTANTLTINTNGGDIQSLAGVTAASITVGSYGSKELIANGNGMWYEV